MYLSILRLWNFRKYCTGTGNEPGIEVHFKDGVNVLIGENDSGKNSHRGCHTLCVEDSKRRVYPI